MSPFFIASTGSTDEQLASRFTDAVADAASRASVTRRPWYVLDIGDDFVVRDNYTGPWTKCWIVGSDRNVVRFEADFCFRVWYRDGSGILVEARSAREARLVAIVHATSEGGGRTVKVVEDL